MMLPKVDRKDFDPQEVLEQLDIDEKIALISGTDFWHTASVPRLGIPAIRTSDGPNGVRGTKFFKGVPAACFPCGTALGATWDASLMRKAGDLMGREAIAKGASVILGPTVNTQRGPLGGRGFESVSEDPFLAGTIAAAEINGIQSTGVAATLKHFVCNDQEDKRMASNSIVSERALREIYLMPFQIAQKDAKPWAYMTAYNLLNGTHCSENPRLLKDILRGEWGFDGITMSDWFGLYSTDAAIKAGLDLEMPGPSFIRGRLIGQAMSCGKVLPHHLDERVLEVLKLVRKVLPLGIPENAPEKTIDSPETAALLREIASSSCVLMKNEDNVLPLSKEKTTAVIGPNAAIAAYCGGGSASLLPYRAVSPLEGVKSKDPEVKYALGAPGWKRLPLLSDATKTKDGKPGLDMTVYLDPPTKKGRKVLETIYVSSSNIPLADYKNPNIEGELFFADFDGTFTPEESARYEFSCSVAGTAKVFVDGKLVVDNATNQTPGDSFFGVGTIEEVHSTHLEKGKTYDVHVEFGTLPTMTYKKPGVTAMGAGGVRLGSCRTMDLSTEIDRAVEVAKSVDQVVLCAGLNGDWESEGYDRTHMDLPPGSDALISAVCKANPKTAVILQSGTPVTMPWISEVSGLIQAWYGGNETGNAIADVVFGDTNPSGKLSLSFPKKAEDNPTFFNFNSDMNRVLYGEDIYLGYRYYGTMKKEVQFPFGHGLSYTKFKLANLQINDPLTTQDDEINISVDVENTGSREGSEVIQVYIQPVHPPINRPTKELKGFEKVHLEKGEKKTVQIRANKKYATSYWDEGRDCWASEKGTYRVLVGDSSDNTTLDGGIEVKRSLYWSGL